MILIFAMIRITNGKQFNVQQKKESMVSTFLALTITHSQCLSLGALAGISSSLLISFLCSPAPTVQSEKLPITPPITESLQNTEQYKALLISSSENLLEATSAHQTKLHQHLIGLDNAFNEYTQIRQELFENLRKRQKLEGKIASILALFESQESELLKTIQDVKEIKMNQYFEIDLLQNQIQSLLQCIEEKDVIIEHLMTNSQQSIQISI